MDTDGSSVTKIATSDGEIRSDAVVLAAGAASPLLTRTMGVRTPVYPAKGYTLTAVIKDPGRAPHIGGIDERSLVAWSRFGGELGCRRPPNSSATTVAAHPPTSPRSSRRVTNCFPERSTGTPHGTEPAFAP